MSARRIAVWIAAMSLAGCYQEDEFRDDLDDAVCTWKAECYQEEYASCINDALNARAETPAGCKFQPGVARDCVDALDDLACVDTAPEDELGFPEVCGEVWSCM